MIDLRIEDSSFAPTHLRLRALRRAMREGDMDAIRRIVAGGLLGDDALPDARGARAADVKGALRSILLISCSPLYRAKSVTHGELLAHGLIESIRFGIPMACTLFIEAGADFQNSCLRRRLAEVVCLRAEEFPGGLPLLRRMRNAGIIVFTNADFSGLGPMETAAVKRFLGLSPFDRGLVI